MRKACCMIACLMVCALALSGCAQTTGGSQATGDPSQSATAAAGQGWGGQLADICGDIPFPGTGTLGGSSLQTSGSVTAGTAQIGRVKLYDYVQWMGLLEKDGWYVFGNEANKGAGHIVMRYSTGDETLHVEVTSDASRGVWPSAVSRELDYMIPYYKASAFVSAQQLQLQNYDQAVRCTFQNAPEQDVQEYMRGLETAGFKNLGHASGLYVLEKGVYEVNVYISLDGDKPIEVTLLKHSVALVPLPPWPETLPQEFAQRLPLVGSPVKTVEEAESGYRIEVNDMSGCEVYVWYSSLANAGWSDISANGNAVNAQAGILLNSVAFDTQSMVFGFTAAHQDSEGTAAVTAQPPTPTAAPKTTPVQNATAVPALTPTNHTSGHNTGDVTYSYRLTSGKYEADDVEFAVKKEFGQKASVADWANIKRDYAGKADSFLTGLGVKHNEDIWVNCNYTGYYEGGRRYFLAKIDGAKRDGFLIHDRWDGDTVWLGSWSGMKLRALALIPSQ